jgi:urocanate hydratase
VVITNGMVIPNYSSKDLYEKMHAQGVTMYGQMTAGSYCCTPSSYLFRSSSFLHSPSWRFSRARRMFFPTLADIGPQGIVHGTTITLLNAGRKYLSTSDLAGKVRSAQTCSWRTVLDCWPCTENDYSTR